MLLEKAQAFVCLPNVTCATVLQNQLSEGFFAGIIELVRALSGR